jgi:hypothetical protein
MQTNNNRKLVITVPLSFIIENPNGSKKILKKSNDLEEKIQNLANLAHFFHAKSFA